MSHFSSNFIHDFFSYLQLLLKASGSGHRQITHKMIDSPNRMSRLKIEGQRDKLDYFPTLIFTFVFTSFRTIFRVFFFLACEIAKSNWPDIRSNENDDDMEGETSEEFLSPSTGWLINEEWNCSTEKYLLDLSPTKDSTDFDEWCCLSSLILFFLDFFSLFHADGFIPQAAQSEAELASGKNRLRGRLTKKLYITFYFQLEIYRLKSYLLAMLKK